MFGFRPVPPEESTCETCGKNLNDLISGEVECKPCEKEAVETAKALPPWVHFFQIFYWVFHFQFKMALGAFYYLIWSLFKWSKK